MIWLVSVNFGCLMFHIIYNGGCFDVCDNLGHDKLLIMHQTKVKRQQDNREMIWQPCKACGTYISNIILSYAYMSMIFERWIFGLTAIYGWMHCNRFSLDGKMHPARQVSPSRQFHHLEILFVHLEKFSHKTLVEDFQKNLQLEKKLAGSSLSRNWKKQNSHCWLFSFPPFQGWQREMGFEIRFGKYISELRGNLFDSSSGEGPLCSETP